MSKVANCITFFIAILKRDEICLKLNGIVMKNIYLLATNKTEINIKVQEQYGEQILTYNDIFKYKIDTLYYPIIQILKADYDADAKQAFCYCLKFAITLAN